MKPRVTHPENLAGLKFGLWLAIEQAPTSPSGGIRWICRCECGTVKNVLSKSLKRGASKSCGCTPIKGNKSYLYKHGMSGSSMHRIWLQINQRCCNPKNKNWKNYGGRGITVCDRWRDSFEDFIDDMGPRPVGMSVERKDNNGNYEPGNCRWATSAEQSRNTRRNRPVEYKGKMVLICDLAKESGLPNYLINQRIFRYGWSVEDAMSKPTMKRGYRHNHSGAVMS